MLLKQAIQFSKAISVATARLSVVTALRQKLLRIFASLFLEHSL